MLGQAAAKAVWRVAIKPKSDPSVSLADAPVGSVTRQALRVACAWRS